LDKLKQTISNVGFYPIVLDPDEAEQLEQDPKRMGLRFEHEMVQRVRAWLALYEEKIAPKGISMYFMPGNDDLVTIDQTIEEFEHVKNPDRRRYWIDDQHEMVGMANANMTPWVCPRDTEEEVLEKHLEEIGSLLEHPERAIAVLHVPPFDSGIDICPQLDENLQIMTGGGQVLMKPVGSTAVRKFIERFQPMLSLHGHIHEAPGHVRIGRTLAVNAGSAYAEGIMKAAIINLDRDRVKGHILISG
jgi:Icc-related predicted phosphoesterase